MLARVLVSGPSARSYSRRPAVGELDWIVVMCKTARFCLVPLVPLTGRHEIQRLCKPETCPITRLSRGRPQHAYLFETPCGGGALGVDQPARHGVFAEAAGDFVQRAVQAPSARAGLVQRMEQRQLHRVFAF
jgi:hypothetical protein